MRTHLLAAIAATLCARAADIVPAPTPAPSSTDKFGIAKLYETAPGGREWHSKWDNGQTRSWPQQQNDPYDPQFWASGKGDGSFRTGGDGILKISGAVPRMRRLYTDTQPNHYGYWHNVEITVYGRRVSDTAIAYGGIVATARANHMIDSELCDTRGYYGQFRYDGFVNFEKETAHGSGYPQTAWKTYWPGGMPYNVWIGYKYVVHDTAEGNVKLELYTDKTDGLNGGKWVKINEFVDKGSNFGVGEPACAAGIDPALRLTSSDSRPGSESGKPNLDVYFESHGVGTDGLWYKKPSIRGIIPAVRLGRAHRPAVPGGLRVADRSQFLPATSSGTGARPPRGVSTCWCGPMEPRDKFAAAMRAENAPASPPAGLALPAGGAVHREEDYHAPGMAFVQHTARQSEPLWCGVLPAHTRAAQPRPLHPHRSELQRGRLRRHRGRD